MSAQPDGAAILHHTRLLADMLATDVQHYHPLIAEITAAISELASGRRVDPRSFHGNVYTLTLDRQRAHIANARDHAVAPETLPLDAFDAAFRHWVAQRG
jgi:hypothetical protein